MQVRLHCREARAVRLAVRRRALKDRGHDALVGDQANPAPLIHARRKEAIVEGLQALYGDAVPDSKHEQVVQ